MQYENMVVAFYNILSCSLPNNPVEILDLKDYLVPL